MISNLKKGDKVICVHPIESQFGKYSGILECSADSRDLCGSEVVGLVNSLGSKVSPAYSLEYLERA